MTESLHSGIGTPHRDEAALLGELEQSLREQLASLEKGRSRDLEERFRRMAELVEAARRMPPESLRRKAAQLEKLRRLHEQLLLTLRQQRDELGASRRRLHGGRRAVRAYGQ